MKDINEIEHDNYLKLDHIEMEKLDDGNYCCGELFTILCGLTNNLIISHFWNTGNKQILRLDIKTLEYHNNWG